MPLPVESPPKLGILRGSTYYRTETAVSLPHSNFLPMNIIKKIVLRFLCGLTCYAATEIGTYIKPPLHSIYIVAIAYSPSTLSTPRPCCLKSTFSIGIWVVLLNLQSDYIAPLSKFLPWFISVRLKKPKSPQDLTLPDPPYLISGSLLLARFPCCSLNRCTPTCIFCSLFLKYSFSRYPYCLFFLFAQTSTKMSPYYRRWLGIILFPLYSAFSR